MSKLFEVPAQSRELVFRLKAYKGNRIATKLVKLLKAGGVYTVKENRRNDPENCRIFTILINSNKEVKEAAQDLKNELISYIPDAFKPNYQFDFTGSSLGFTRSFEVFNHDFEVEQFVCYHNIKEVKTSGESLAPLPKDQIKI